MVHVIEREVMSPAAMEFADTLETVAKPAPNHAFCGALATQTPPILETVATPAPNHAFCGAFATPTPPILETLAKSIARHRRNAALRVYF